MEDRQRELGRPWSEVAALGGIKTNTVYRVRAGTASILPTTRRAIEKGMSWSDGSVDVILAGGDPTPAEEQGPASGGSQIWVTLPGGAPVMVPVVLSRIPGLEDLPEAERQPLLEETLNRMVHAGWEFLHEAGQARQKGEKLY
ncbi:hypothetical protein ACFYOC_25545 [Nocardiopsis alba]|uniref:hypothetical protein n=1 Tax=Nocardiopsis alba TaxID=53437 RepID=UPI003684C12C